VSKRKKTNDKKPATNKVTKLPVRWPSSSDTGGERKLSEIIKEMALRLLKDPDAGSSEPATIAALMLAGAAWNSAIGDNAMRDQHRSLVAKIDWGGVSPWSELRSDDTERLVTELVAYKREHYPNDLRRVVATEMSPEGSVRVHWTDPEKVVAAPFGSSRPEATSSNTKRGGPIADKLKRK